MLISLYKLLVKSAFLKFLRRSMMEIFEIRNDLDSLATKLNDFRGSL